MKLIRKGNPEEKEAIINIWQRCFGDEREYIEMFLREKQDEVTPVVCEKDGSLVSMLFLFPCSFRLSGEDFPAFYLYAAATLPEFRGEGIMGEMIEFSKAYAEEKGKEFIILSPAEESLYSYYNRFGFVPCFKSDRITLSCSSRSDKLLPADASKAYKLRNTAFSDGVLWDESAFNYAVKENEFCGGKSAFYKTAYGIYYKNKDSIIFKEVFAESEKSLISLVNKICREEKCENALLSLPEGQAVSEYFKEKRKVKTGMAAPLSERAENILSQSAGNAYLALTLA